MKKILIILFIFSFSIILRIWNLNEIGRTWDEPEYVEQGYRMIELIKKGDFNNSYLYTTYDHPPLVKYLYGLAAHLDVKRYLPSGEPILNYDLAFSRGLSAIASSLAVVVVVMFGFQFISRFVGIAAGIILATLPFFLGLSQLVTAESWVMLFFSAAVFSYMLFLKDYSLCKLVITGVITGIALQVKQSNGILLPLFILLYIAWFLRTKKGNKFSFVDPRLTAILFILVISVIVFILFWPMVLFHFNDVYAIHRDLWHVQFSPKPWQITLSPPEVFFGRLMLTPVFYYFVLFLITTPIIILVLFFVGLKAIDKKKEWILYAITIWFLIPFLLSFYSWCQHGVRYIIEIYAPMSLIAAIGFDYLVNKLTKNDLKNFFFLFH